MIRFIVKEEYSGHAVNVGGQIETTITTFDGDILGLENYLRYKDQKNGQRSEYLTREFVGIELINEKR